MKHWESLSNAPTQLNVRECGHNAQCTLTAGMAKWCSGPRTDKCYWLDNAVPSRPVWKQDFRLPSARAHAASVVLPDGRLWILGGLADPADPEVNNPSLEKHNNSSLIEESTHVTG